jgi:hypothetical protein
MGGGGAVATPTGQAGRLLASGRWRDKIRQAVKDGVDFNAQVVDGELGLVFTGVVPRKQIGLATHETLFLADFTQAIKWSSRLARAVVDDIAGNWPEDRRVAVERQD